MSYTQLEEPKYWCPKCNKEYGLNAQQIQYGLFSDGKLIKCSRCFEQMKHDFWLKISAEENL